MAHRLIEQFERLLRSDEVDVASFLASHPQLSPDERLQLLLIDQSKRFETGRPLSVEDYLERVSELRDDPDALLALIAGEHEARASRDTAPELSEWTRRFPELANRIREHLSEIEARSRTLPRETPTDRPQSTSPPQTFSSELADEQVLAGRYRVIRRLGEGGFGCVYLAFDNDLRRSVAIKVPKSGRFRWPEDADQYLIEARTVAALSHPHIVPVHDMGRTDEGEVFVVSRYIDGGTLADRIREGPLDPETVASFLQTIAVALGHAHSKGLIHRDIKPANILIETASGQPFLTDFGLAIREYDDAGQLNQAGTPPYMSPEQARREGHRLDPRSDLFSLGIVMYESLTNTRPFCGGTLQEVLHHVITLEPPPPRSLRPEIPGELERICLKLLCKQASDRYASATDLANDLSAFLASDRRSEPAPDDDLPVVPKGLRSFDADDADFFLTLLPGARDRAGLPESIAFWKRRIEERDGENTFTVGLIYGPSGCGKSSLVKAGLFPRLTGVEAILVEATADDTETRLLRALKKRIPKLQPENDLTEVLGLLRRGGGNKVVLIIDQFEQWLHCNRIDMNAGLVSALRQCDGERVQAIVMVRDDFAMPAARLMDAVDVPIVQGENFATVDLFDIDHAAKVLTKFGRGYGRLPASPTPLSDDQQRFVAEVASGLAQDGRVISVRLALFAAMTKFKPWVPETLRQVGGTTGIGINFLEDSFSSRSANPAHRAHAAAAERVLRALLPELDSDIRGNMQSADELQEACGYRDRDGDFTALLRILDGELRLITPTDPEGRTLDDSVSDAPAGSQRHYQLTHDYLIPSLREWLTRKQRETRRGRAELQLQERSSHWNAKPESRYLPSLREWLQIRTLTRWGRWTEPQRQMMRRADRFHILRSAVALLAIAVVTVTGIQLRSRVRTEGNRLSAERLVESLATAETPQVPEIVRQLEPYRKWAAPMLADSLSGAANDSKEKLHFSIALAQRDPGQVAFLFNRLLHAKSNEVGVIRTALSPYRAEVQKRLWAILLDTSENRDRTEGSADPRHLRAAAALAEYDATNEKWDGLFIDLTDQVVSVNPVYLRDWIDLLRPIDDGLIGPLTDIYRDPERRGSERKLAAEVLAEYVSDQTDVLVDLIQDADEEQFAIIFDRLQPHGTAAIERLEAALEPDFEPGWRDEPLPEEWPAVAPSLEGQIEQAGGIVADRSAFCTTMPLSQFRAVCEALKPSGYRPIRFRPYQGDGSSEGRDITERPSASDTQTMVAAVWTRDGRDYRLTSDQTPDEVRSLDRELQDEGFLPVDAAGYVRVTGNAEGEGRYAALWTRRQNDADDARLFVGVGHPPYQEINRELARNGFHHATTQHFHAPSAGPRYSFVQQKMQRPRSRGWGRWDKTEESFQMRTASASMCIDLSMMQALYLPNPTSQLPLQIDQITRAISDDPDDLTAVRRRGVALHQLKRDEEAIVDLDRAVEALPEDDVAYRYRAVSHARLGNADKAAADVKSFSEMATTPSQVAYLDAVVAAWLGDQSGLTRLRRSLAEHRDDDAWLYKSACAFAVASEAFATDEELSEECQITAGKLLTRAVAAGYVEFEEIRDNMDLVPIRQRDEFRLVMTQGRLDHRYWSLWERNLKVESIVLSDLSTDRYRDRAAALLAQGYRPTAISVVTLASPTSDGIPNAAGVWHRPRVELSGRIEQARRQAGVAIAMLRQGQREKILSVLRFSDDPESMTQFIHRCRARGVTSAELWDCVGVVDRGRTSLRGGDRRREDRVLYALLLALGEFTSREIPPSLREPVVEQIVEWFRDDPSSAVHGATGWLLRHWGEGELVAEIEQTPVEYQSGREWFRIVIPAGDQKFSQTYVVFPPGDYEIGSPPDEPNRLPDEHRHTVKLTRPFAILDRELTRAEIEASGIKELNDYAIRQLEKYSPTPAHAMTSTSWYDGVRFCRWWTERAGWPESEQCYLDPDGLDPEVYPPDITTTAGGAPQNWPHDFSRCGFRLPTEAEWEIAARAGVKTAYGFGHDSDLLDRYGWFRENSGDHAQVPRSLRPNVRGVFDMHGNVHNWCHDWYSLYPKEQEPLVDPLGPSGGSRIPVTSGLGVRVTRSGGWDSNYMMCRIANRDSKYGPGSNGIRFGLRLALVPSSEDPVAAELGESDNGSREASAFGAGSGGPRAP